MLYGLTRGWSGSALTAAAVTSMTVDISGATVGETVYAWVNIKWSETTTTFTGWTSLFALQSQSLVGTYILYKRLKVAGDTTFTLSWTSTAVQALVLLQQWPGTVADEGAAEATRASAANVFPTPAGTPTDGNRWAVGFFCAQNGDSTNKTVTWTPSGDMTTPVQSGVNVNGSGAFCNSAITDSNGPVTIASHTGTETTSGTTAVGNGAAAIMFLIPASSYRPTPTLQAVNRAAVI